MVSISSTRDSKLRAGWSSPNIRHKAFLQKVWMKNFAQGNHEGTFPLWNLTNNRLLGGGFQYFLCSPLTLGKMSPFWRAYFSIGLKPPTRLGFVWFTVIFVAFYYEKSKSPCFTTIFGENLFGFTFSIRIVASCKSREILYPQKGAKFEANWWRKNYLVTW